MQEGYNYMQWLHNTSVSKLDQVLHVIDNHFGDEIRIFRTNHVN